MIQEFKEFIQRGNVVDLAVAVVIGGAFGKIVVSFVEDVLMPPIGLVLGGLGFLQFVYQSIRQGFPQRRRCQGSRRANSELWNFS